MSHEHKLRDTDPYFRIDPDTRVITDLSDKGTTIVQNDHNSEKFTFELPRFIDGHDMSLCNVVEVHYINIGSNERHNDVYEIPKEDRETIRLANSTDEALLCTWLLSQSATSLAGTLSFALRFMCTSTGEDGEAIIDYSWGTGIYTKTIITPGINNSEAVVEQYADVLEEWRQQLFSGGGGGNVDSYSKTEIDEKINHHDHRFASGYSEERVSQFEIEEISGNFKSFNNGVIEVSGKTLLGFLSMDYYTNATAQFKLLSGTANVYYGIEYGMLGGGGGFKATSVVLTTEESVTVNAKGSITSLVDLGGATFSENCLIIIEAVDAKIVVEAYKKSVYSDGFMSGENAEKLQNTYTKEEVDNKIGSIDTALDEILKIQNVLIGGAN